jgi:hypothetical protein
MAGATFTITTQFGISNGPNYTGNNVVAPPVSGNNPQLITSQACPANTNTTVWTGNAAYTDLQPSGGLGGGLGFQIATAALNGNVNTPSVTVLLKNGANTALSIALSSGQSWAVANPATLWTNTTTNTITSIVVQGDTVSNTTINGILNFNT